MMQKVSEYYQELHRNEVVRLKAFIEPILIIGLTFGVGVIILAVIIPMFDLYQQIELNA
jgi:type IV pilus assembly protein PilC